MPLEDLVAQGGNDVSLQGVIALARELVVGLSGGDELILELSGAVLGLEGVVADAGDVGAIAGSPLLDEDAAVLLSATERVGRVARAHDGILCKNKFMD